MNNRSFAVALVTLAFASGCGHTLHRVQGAELQRVEGVYIHQIQDRNVTWVQSMRLDLGERQAFFLPGGWWEADIVPYTEDTLGRWQHMGTLKPRRYEDPRLLDVGEDRVKVPVSWFFWDEPGNHTSAFIKPGEYDVELVSMCPSFEGAGAEVARATRHLCVGYAVHVIIVVPESKPSTPPAP